MKKHISRRTIVVAGLCALAGSTTIIANKFPQKSIGKSGIKRMNIKSKVAFETIDETVINRPVNEVFSFVTNLQNSSKISDHLNETKILTNGNGLGDQYSRKLVIHGFENEQTVTVTDYEKERLFQTSTELFGVPVVHTYRFISDGNGLVKIQLLKQSLRNGWVDGIYQPFVTHQLTRPEHDGQHLSKLKKAVEAA